MMNTNPDLYIYGAIMIYVDIIRLFLEILRILQKSKDEERRKK